MKCLESFLRNIIIEFIMEKKRKRRSVAQQERSPSNDKKNSQFTAFSIEPPLLLFLA